MRYTYFCIVLLILVNTTQLKAQSQITVGSTTLDIDTVVTGLNVPWEVLYGPDGKLWVTEREGIISRVDIATGNKEVLLDIQNAVYATAEAGMLGMVLHPDFPQTPYLYVTYNYGVSGNVRERMVRYTFDTDTLINPVTFLDNITGFNTHNGCRMVIGTDDKIYMTTGDAQNQPSAQDVNALTGKVLRLELDGSVPADNPIPGSYIYSWGHRNAQGLAFGPTGILYSSEHGPNTDDELNIIEEARNYGWPTVAGYCNTTAELSFCADSNVREPLLAWTPTIATSDLIYYDHPAIPEWQGTLLMTVLKNKQLKQLNLNAAGDTITSDITYLSNQFGRLRDIVAGPDGTIYIATNGANWSNTDPGTHSIIRLKNNAYQSPLMVTLADTIELCGTDSTVITASVIGGTAPYTYQWNPTAGLSDPSIANPIVYTDSAITYYVTITDDDNNNIVDTITILPVELTNDTTTDLAFNISVADTSGFLLDLDLQSNTYEVIEVYSTIDTTLLHTFNSPMFTFSPEDLVCTLDEPTSLCSGSFTICAIDLNTCTKVCKDSSFTINYIYNSVEDAKLQKIQLYPNPAQNRLYVKNITEDIELSIIDLQGRVLTQDKLKAHNNHTVDLSGLAGGMYLVKMVSGNGERTVKLLVD